MSTQSGGKRERAPKHAAEGRSTRAGARWFGAVFLGGTLLGASCAQVPLPHQGPAARESTRQAELLARSGDYAAAAREYRRVAERALVQGDRETRADALVECGEHHLRAGERALARVALGDALAAIGTSPRERALALRSHTGLGDVDLLDGHPDNSRYQYERALEYAQGSLQRDSLLVRLVRVERAAGRTEAAERWRAQIRAPDSPALAEIDRALGGSAASAQEDPSLDSILGPPPVLTPHAPLLPPTLARADWNAAAPGKDLEPMGRIWRLTIHHTGVRFTSTAKTDAAEAIRGFQRHHQNEKKWADIGYHFLIDPAGRVWQGRSLRYKGAHAGNPDLNRGNIGIALLGSFSEQPLPRAQAAALVRWVTLLGQQYQIRADHFHTHQDIRPDPTDCPGRALATLVVQLRDRALANAPRFGPAVPDALETAAVGSFPGPSEAPGFTPLGLPPTPDPRRRAGRVRRA